jgi:hypothetical protein
MSAITAILIFEWVSFLVSLIYFKKLGRDGRWITYFLALVVLSETVGTVVRIYKNNIAVAGIINTWYNIMLPAQFISLLLLFFNKTTFSYWKIAIKAFIGIILCITILQFFVSAVTEFNTFNYTLGAIFISACSLHYLFELMNSKEIETVTRDPFLYLSVGLLLFYLGTLPFSSMRKYLFEAHRNIFYIYYYLFFGFNYFLYGVITFGILWAKKK